VNPLSLYMPRGIEENHEIRLSAYLDPRSTWNHYYFNTSHIMTAATASGAFASPQNARNIRSMRSSLDTTQLRTAEQETLRYCRTSIQTGPEQCDTVELPSRLGLNPAIL
jgi:hypothetical protein